MEWLFASWPTLIVLGIGIRMALRLTYGARGPEPGDPVHGFLNITGWVLIAVGLVPGLIGGAISIVGLIIILLAAATFVEMIVLRRAAERRSMCRMLALVLDRGAHLESSVFLAGQSLRGIVGSSARGLFDAMNRGMPLLAAIARYPSALPRETSAFLAAGTSRQARIAALREISRPAQGELTTLWRDCVDRLAYLLVILLVMTSILTFIMIKIVPEFQKIFYEFDLDLPMMTQVAVNFSKYFVQFLGVPTFMIFAILIVAATIVGICYLCDQPVLSGISDRLFRGRHIANVLRIIALATEFRGPLADVLHRLAITYPARRIRRRLDIAANRVDAGASWQDALHSARLVTQSEQSLLTTAEQAGNLPWALREIASRREKLAIYWIATRLQVLYPFIILSLGLFVAFYAISLFIPIVNLIDGLSK